MKTIRQFNNPALAELAKAVLESDGIQAAVMGDNLSITGGPEFGLNYVQLAILIDNDYEKADTLLIENGFA